MWVQNEHISYLQKHVLHAQDQNTQSRKFIYVFSVVTCGFPGKPTNGAVSSGSSSHNYNSRVTYSCNAGYTLVGRADNLCLQSGSWRNNAPTCRSKIFTTYLRRKGEERQKKDFDNKTSEIHCENVFCPRIISNVLGPSCHE